MKAAENHIDRRNALRAPFLADLSYSFRNSSSIRNGRAIVRDLSRSGLSAVLDRPLTPKQVVEFELRLPEAKSPTKVGSEVIWQRRASGGLDETHLVGLRFLELDSPIQEQIDRFVSDLLRRHSQVIEGQAVGHFDKRIRLAQAPWPIQMTTLRTTHARVAATGAYLPSTSVTNAELISRFGETLQPVVLQRSLGAVERRAISPEETGADLMVRAGQAILNQAGCDPRDLDRIICSIDPGDAVAPSTAVAVQAKLGAACPAYDVTMSCAGWICGVDQALRALASGEQWVLVLACSTVGSRLPFRDLKHRAIFGDAAAGLLLKAASEGELLSTALWTDGRFYSKIFAPYPWSVHPADVPREYQGRFYMDPDQNVFFRELSRVLPPFFKRLLLDAEVTVDNINHFFLHQPSRPLFEHSLQLLKAIPREKVVNCFPKYGNIVAAELPVILAEGVSSGRIKRGDRICMVTYGAGFTMAGLVMQY